MNELKNELNNPNRLHVVDEYAKLQIEIELIEDRLTQLGF